MSERKPVGTDLPIFTATPGCKGSVTLWKSVVPNSVDGEVWIHARNLPVPPPRELTQREKDEAAAKEIENAYIHDGSRHGVEEIALMAIHRERREILEALDAAMQNECGRNWCEEKTANLFAPPAFKAIRARLEEQGQSK